MALTNNLVVDPEDFPALAEAMSERQPGDKLRLTIEVTVVENLTERKSFDVDEVETIDSIDSSESESTTEGEGPENSVIADSVLGVMAKKKGQ